MKQLYALLTAGLCTNSDGTDKRLYQIKGYFCPSIGTRRKHSNLVQASF